MKEACIKSLSLDKVGTYRTENLAQGLGGSKVGKVLDLQE